MQDGLLPIGMFSRASSLSIKVLRAYHEAGILVPAQVDPRTGYRAYTVDQLADAAVVVRLRALDLPLGKVREVLHGRDPELTRRVLAGHQLAMQERLAETERIVAELQSGVAPVTHTPAHVRYDEGVHTVRILGEVTTQEFGSWLGWAYGRLAAFLDIFGIAPVGPAGALYGAEIVDDGVEQVEAFFPVTSPFAVPREEREIALGEVPGTWVAVLVHAGDYDSINDTYRALGAWVARNATHSAKRVRERYLIGPSEVDDPKEFRTEIAWPIRVVGLEDRRHTMTLRLGNVTLDCADTKAVASFWSAALDRKIDEGASEWFTSIGYGDESQTGWFFIKVPEGKVGKNRMHVDLRADDREVEVARLVALGARRGGDFDEYGHHWTTLFDVEGNEFCVG